MAHVRISFRATRFDLARLAALQGRAVFADDAADVSRSEAVRVALACLSRLGPATVDDLVARLADEKAEAFADETCTVSLLPEDGVGLADAELRYGLNRTNAVRLALLEAEGWSVVDAAALGVARLRRGRAAPEKPIAGAQGALRELVDLAVQVRASGKRPSPESALGVVDAVVAAGVGLGFVPPSK